MVYTLLALTPSLTPLLSCVGINLEEEQFLYSYTSEFCPLEVANMFCGQITGSLHSLNLYDITMMAWVLWCALFRI